MKIRSTPGCPPLAKLGWATAAQLLLLASSVAQTASPAPKSPFAGLIAEYLRLDANGHSPSADEIAAMATLQPAPDAADLREAMPYLLKALDNPDIPLHTFALTTLVGLQTQPAPADPANPTPAGPATYKPDIAKVLTPYVSQIAANLTSEDVASNRLLAATILGGFTPDTPATVYTPLLAYLKRDDAISPVGLAVVADLIQLGSLADATTDAVAHYLRRSDQTSDSRSNLADLIATHANQSQSLNKTLLLYLNSDDNALRARVILSLPQLDLAQDVYADTKSRLDQIAADPNENLQVVTAAKSVAPCWTAIKMATGCPVY